MPRIATQSNEERLEKKRLAERIRMDRIRNDPGLYALWQSKRKENYIKKKQQGKILPIANMPQWKQNLVRQKSREYSRRWYKKKSLKKMTELANYKETDIQSENSDTGCDEHCDPLESMTDVNSGGGASTSPNSHTDCDTLFNCEVKLEPQSPSHSQSSMPTHWCHSPPNSLSEILPNDSGLDRSSTDTNEHTEKQPSWFNLFRKFENSVKTELENKDKTIEELKLLNERYKTQIHVLLNAVKHIPKTTKCSFCNRELE